MIYLENEKDFNEEIKKEIVLVDFYATWCGPCRLLEPVIETFAKEHEDVHVVKVDVDKFPNISREYTIMSIPTLLVFKDGKLANKHIGYLEKKQIEDLIK